MGAAAKLPWRPLFLDLPFRNLPLAYKLVLLGLGTILVVTAAVMAVTFLSAGEGLKLQMERQLSRDLNVVEAWYRARAEEVQLTALGLARERGDLAAPLAREARRLGLELAVLVDARGAARYGLDGLVGQAIARGEQRVSTEALPDGLFRLVVTPVAGRGALVLGERVGAAVPRQVVSMIGGAVAVLDRERVLAQAGWPSPPRLPDGVQEGVRAGRYFFAEADAGGRTYLLAFRPLLDHRGAAVGAIARAFPEAEIAETLFRFAGGIVVIASAAVGFALLAFFLLTRRLLFPLRRLASLSAGLAAAPVPRGVARDEIGLVAHGVTNLADRLTQSREELAAEAAAKALLLEKLITAQEDERKRLARELHDQTGQSLTGLLVGLKYVEGAPTLEAVRERTEALRQLAVQTLEEVHQLSVALRPAMLDDLGLVAALRTLVDDFAAQHGVPATFTADVGPERLPPRVEVTLYRIVQEGLTNAAKYARAGAVAVSLRVADGRLTLVVADDGVGFDPQAAGGRERLGLLGMAERVSLIGGTLSIDSAPGRGTRIEVHAHA